MKVSVFVAIVCLFLVLSQTANAHSGRTDSSGGHNCTSKSISKGLCSGYHYHNGGSSSGSSSNSSSNSSTTTTIDYAAIEKSDRIKGEKAGLSAGLSDGTEGKENNSLPTGSLAYNEAYKAFYQEGYDQGNQKFELVKAQAYDAGSELGYQQDELVIAEVYQDNSLLSQSFENGFEASVAKRDAEKETEYITLGYEDGKKDISNEPKDVKSTYLKSYQEGYSKGNDELKQSFIEQGYEAAFIMVTYNKPKLANIKYEAWYKEGYDNNDKAVAIRNAANDSGKQGEHYVLPGEYQHAEAIYKHHYEAGAEQRKQEKRTLIVIVVVIVLGWFLRRMYVAWKMIK